MAAAQPVYFRWAGWELLWDRWRPSGGVDSRIYTWDRVESSGEMSRILVVRFLCQCSAGLGGPCQFLSVLAAPVSAQVEMLGWAVGQQRRAEEIHRDSVGRWKMEWDPSTRSLPSKEGPRTRHVERQGAEDDEV